MDKVVFSLSIFGVIFAGLAFFVDWLWIIPAVVIMLYNQRRLFNKKKS